jgi:hypothetical protein
VRVLHDAVTPSPPLQLPLLFHGGRKRSGGVRFACRGETREGSGGGSDLNGFVQETYVRVSIDLHGSCMSNMDCLGVGVLLVQKSE